MVRLGYGRRCQVWSVQGTGGGVKYGQFSSQVWSVQCTGGGVRYGELRLRVEVSDGEFRYWWKCQVS